MRRFFSFRHRGVVMGGLVGAALLAAAAPAPAQVGGLSSGGLSTGGLSSSGLSSGGLSSGGLGGSRGGLGGGLGSSGGLGGGLGSSGGLGGGLGSSGGLGGGLGSSGGLGGGLGSSGMGNFGGGLGGVGGSTGFGSGRGGFQGGFQGGFTGGGTGTTFPGVATSNPLRQYFYNPMSYGVPNGNGNGSFGTPLYNITTNNALGTLNGLGTANVNANRPVGATSIGVRRSSFYTTTLDPSLIPAAPMPPARLQADLQNVLARSTRLPSAANVRVTVEGDVVVLQGTVGSERERRLTEAAVRLTPGVHDVRNELEVAGGATATAGR